MPETGSNCRAAAATTTTTTTTKKKNKTCDKASISLLRQQSCTEMAGRLTKSTCANDSFLKRKNDIHFGQKEEESMIDDANQGEFHRADVLLRREIPEVTLGLSLSRKGTEECATTQYDDLVESYHPPDDAATVVVPHTNPNAYFGASRMHSASGSLWNREDDDDNELRRLQELRLLAGRAEGTFGMMQRQRRGMMLTPPHGAGGTSQLSELEEDEVMRLHHFRELYRRQVLHRDQLSFSLDQHYDQIQREKHLLLDLQLERRGHYASYPDDHEDPLVVLRRRERESGGGGLTTRERILLSRDRITNSTSNPACNSRGSFFSLERPTGLSMLPQLYPPFRDPYTSLRSVRPVFENPTPGAQYESTTRNHLSYEERLDIAVAAARRRKEASETFHRTQNSVLGKRSFTDDCDLLQQLEGHHGTLSGNALRNLSDQTDRPAHLPARKLPSLGRALYSSKHKNATVDTALCTGNGMDSASSTSSDDLNDGIAQLIEVYSHGGIKEAPFPLKLHAILANPAYEDIIGWLPHGKAWKIFQVSLFEKVLVPRHFRHAKYASFMRQVNGWGFQRKPHHDSQVHNAYYHDLFVRDDPKKCLTMIRFGAKKNAAGQHVTASDDDDDAHEHEPGPPKKKCADDSERQQHKKYSSEIATVAASANEKSGEKVLSKAGSPAEIHRTRSGKRYAGDTGGTNEDNCSDLSSTYKGKER